MKRLEAFIPDEACAGIESGVVDGILITRVQ